jgi:hypothetical protein
MTAVDVQQLVLGQALVRYQKYLESLREQQENNLPRNGKATATAEDLSIDRAFDEQLQAIASLLTPTEESPEQTIQKTKRPLRHAPAPVQTVKPMSLDEFDTESYINPFTGQLITPETPFTAGSSNSHINAHVSRQARPEVQIVDHSQRQQAPAKLQKSFTLNPSTRAAENYSPADRGVERLSPPQHKSAEFKGSFDTRNVVPAARSYASQPEVFEEARLPRARWGTISRIKHMSSKASSKARSEKRTERPQDDIVGYASPKIHGAALAKPSSLDFPATKIVNLDTDTRQSLRQHRQAKCLDTTSDDGQKRLLQKVQGFGRYEILPPNRNTNASESLAPSIIIKREAPRSTSDASPVTQLKRRHHPSLTLPTSFWDRDLPEISPKIPRPPRHPPQISATQSNSSVSVHQEANQPLPGARRSSKKSKVSPELANTLLPLPASLGWTEDRASKGSEFSGRVPELTLDEESRKLALDLSGGFPQDYKSLKQIQEEHEICAGLLQSRVLAKELAGGSPQDDAEASRLRTEHESVLEKSRLADMEWTKTFEADRKLAQSLAAEDVPQQIQHFHRIDRQRQLKLQEEARVAKEIAGREDRAKMQAQLEMARRIQAEWDASEASQIAEQQRLAQEIAEREDRLELERLLAEMSSPTPTQTTNRSVVVSATSLDADPRLVDYPPTDIFQNKRDPKRSSPRPRTRPLPPQQQAPADTSSNRDAEELSSLIAQRRARHGQWQAEVQKAKKEAEEAIRKRAKEDEEEIRRLEQQRVLAERARMEKEAQQRAIEAERQARQGECTVCAEAAEKTDMAILSCNHAYCGGCIARKLHSSLFHIRSFTANHDNRGIPACPKGKEAVQMLSKPGPCRHGGALPTQSLRLLVSRPSPRTRHTEPDVLFQCLLFGFHPSRQHQGRYSNLPALHHQHLQSVQGSRAPRRHLLWRRQRAEVARSRSDKEMAAVSTLQNAYGEAIGMLAYDL